MNKVCIFLLSILSFGGLFAVAANAEIGTTFPLRLTLDLCAEVQYQSVAVDVFYTVGESATLQAATITDQAVNKSQLRGTFDLLLPSIYGKERINVFAFCRNSFGFSASSNSVSVTNCDALSLLDTDGDGIPNEQEDLDCSNFFSPGDSSNPDNVDTDGDGVRDLVEIVNATDPTNPGSSPRPFVYAGAPFDPDGNGNSNPVVWRSANGTWFIKDFAVSGTHIAQQFGLPGDIPIVYDSDGSNSNVGVIRNSNNQLIWFLNGGGFKKSNGLFETQIPFGIFGDNVILGPWEKPGVTNPAVARLYNNHWFFYIYQSDGSIRGEVWGGNGDIPKVQDYDGDGLFDIAVFRPSEQKTYIINSSDNSTHIYTFGTGTADHTVRGDYTGDGIDDISFWEPTTGMFSTLTSNNGFDETLALSKDPAHFFETQLGLYFVHLPISWNRQGSKMLYTVVDHTSGIRYSRQNNNPAKPIIGTQWGLPGDTHL